MFLFTRLSPFANEISLLNEKDSRLNDNHRFLIKKKHKKKHRLWIESRPFWVSISMSRIQLELQGNHIHTQFCWISPPNRYTISQISIKFKSMYRFWESVEQSHFDLRLLSSHSRFQWDRNLQHRIFCLVCIWIGIGNTYYYLQPTNCLS